MSDRPISYTAADEFLVRTVSAARTYTEVAVAFDNGNGRQLQVARFERQLTATRFHEFLVVAPDGLRPETQIGKVG